MSRVTRLGRAVGPGVALWGIVPVLLWRAVPGAPALLVLALAVVGLAAHVGCRLLSNGAWFSGPRSLATLVAATLAIAGTSSAGLTGIAVAGQAVTVAGRDVDGLLLAAAWATATVALTTAFSDRVEFRAWMVRHAEIRERTRPFASAPIGPDRAAIVDLVDDLSAAVGDGVPADLPELAVRLRLTSDDRFRRRVPWATARPLLTAAAQHAGRLGATPVNLSLAGGDDGTPVLIGPIADLVHELAANTRVRSIAVTAESGRDDGPVGLLVACSHEPHPADALEVSTGTVRALDRLGVVVDRPSPGELVVRTSFDHAPEDEDPEDVEAVLSASVELLAESPFSRGARRVYRRGNSVIKVQRHDRFDPKPTQIEDEFHLLRRLRGRSSRFPVPMGYGIEQTFSWIAYEHVEGQPLDQWLADHRDQAPGRLLSFGVDLNEMLDELSSCHVAHRDLNPGNLVMDASGGLVLIDFDQGASGLDYVGADRSGVEVGLAKNDLASFLSRTELTRPANELVAALDEAWPDRGVPFSLGVFGVRFGDGWPIEPLLSAARERLGPLDGCRVLDLQRTVPIAGLLLASAGADVTAVVDRPDRWRRLAALVGPRFEILDADDVVSKPFDLRIRFDHESHGASRTVGDTMVVEHTGHVDDRRQPRSTWFTTTRLTQVGSTGP